MPRGLAQNPLSGISRARRVSGCAALLALGVMATAVETTRAQQVEAPSVVFSTSQTTDAATFVFGPRQRIVVQALLLPDHPTVLQDGSATPAPITDILGVRSDDPQLGAFSVIGAHWTGRTRLCGARRLVALVLLRRDALPDRLVAISGAFPGEPGATICSVRDVKVQYPGK